MDPEAPGRRCRILRSVTNRTRKGQIVERCPARFARTKTCGAYDSRWTSTSRLCLAIRQVARPKIRSHDVLEVLPIRFVTTTGLPGERGKRQDRRNRSSTAKLSVAVVGDQWESRRS